VGSGLQNPAILEVQIQENARRPLKFSRLFRAYAQPQISKAILERVTAGEA
jgi:hypothetical protein